MVGAPIYSEYTGDFYEIGRVYVYTQKPDVSILLLLIVRSINCQGSTKLLYLVFQLIWVRIWLY